MSSKNIYENSNSTNFAQSITWNWWLDDKSKSNEIEFGEWLNEKLTEHALERITAMHADGFTEGELLFHAAPRGKPDETTLIKGWWRLNPVGDTN